MLETACCELFLRACRRPWRWTDPLANIEWTARGGPAWLESDDARQSPWCQAPMYDERFIGDHIVSKWWLSHQGASSWSSRHDHFPAPDTMELTCEWTAASVAIPWGAPAFGGAVNLSVPALRCRPTAMETLVRQETKPPTAWNACWELISPANWS
ncbi:hypothetical protein GCM10023238_29860 [Streptomyces heliomycini]